jgi:hypothetical protein
MQRTASSMVAGAVSVGATLALLTAASGAALAQGIRAPGAQHKGDGKPPLVLETQGFFFAGGQIYKSTSPGREPYDILLGQAYVEYFIPQHKRYGRNTPPIILTHSGINGTIWGTTPDGWGGWALFFTREGFPVYAIDPPGTGRAGFNIDTFNLVREGLVDPSAQPELERRDSFEWERVGRGEHGTGSSRAWSRGPHLHRQ